MRCPECSADVSAIREFCPICGAALHSSIRDSELGGKGPRTNEARQRSPKGFLIGGAVAILLGLGLTGQFNFDEPSIPFEQVQPRGPVTIEAEALHKAFRDDPEGAARLYNDREIEVSGEFLRIVPDGYGSLDLRLKTSDPQDPLGIDVTQLAIEDAKRLRPGQRVTLSCQHMGSGADEVWVQDCAIQLPADAPAPPTGPSPPAGEAKE